MKTLLSMVALILVLSSCSVRVDDGRSYPGINARIRDGRGRTVVAVSSPVPRVIVPRGYLLMESFLVFMMLKYL